MTIEWRRGDKKSETRTTFELQPGKPLAFVNETFSKSSVFYLNNKTGKYFKKLAVIRVKGYTESGGNKEKIMGEIELDISNFVGIAGETKTLFLNKALPNSTLTLQISIQQDLGNAKAQQLNQNLSNDNKNHNNFIDDSSSDEETLNKAADNVKHSGSFVENSQKSK